MLIATSRLRGISERNKITDCTRYSSCNESGSSTALRVCRDPTKDTNQLQSECIRSGTAVVQDQPAQEPVTDNNNKKITNPFASLAVLVSISVENLFSVDEALIATAGSGVHAVAASGTIGRTAVHASTKLVDHHALEDVTLVVNVVEDVSPENVELLWWHKETTSAHPQTVCKGSTGQSDDEDRYQGGDENDQRLGGDQIEEQPHDPSPESLCFRTEVAEPITDDREENGDDEEVWNTGDEVGDGERGGAVETVGTLLHVESAVLQESGDVCNSHERHESTTEEDGIDKGLNVCLLGRQPQPYGTHHDGQTHVHCDTDTVGDDISV